MSFINYESQEKIFKVVYWGPSLAGKTENLRGIAGRARKDRCGELITLATETEQTAYFEFLPISLGTIQEFKVRLHLFTVPGSEGYEASRAQILKGADAVIFVADSNPKRLVDNRVSHQDLTKALKECGSDGKTPIIYQLNKADLKKEAALNPSDILQNPDDALTVSASASEGQGVFETLRGVVARLL